MPFPGPASDYPTKDETATYFETYAREFGLPVRTGVKVDRLSTAGDHFEAFCGDEVLSADNVVVATGAYHHPRVPAFASGLDEAIIQLHSSNYRNGSQLRKGGVLVVGAGNSGAEIAMDLAGHHRIWLSGPDTGQEPTRAGSIPDRLLTPIMWLAATRLTVRTFMGRKLRDHFLDPPRGIPLGRVRRKDIVNAGIERVGRTTGVRDGYPVLEDGRASGSVERDLVHRIHARFQLDRSRAPYHPPRVPDPGPRHRRVRPWSLLHGAPVPVLAQLGAGGRSGPATLSTSSTTLHSKRVGSREVCVTRDRKRFAAGRKGPSTYTRRSVRHTRIRSVRL